MITELLIAYFSEFKNTVFAELDALGLYFFKAKCEGAYISEGSNNGGGGKSLDFSEQHFAEASVSGGFVGFCWTNPKMALKGGYHIYVLPLG